MAAAVAAAATVAPDAGWSATAVRLRVAWRVVRAAELLALAVLLFRSFPRLPYVAAAASSALRLAASLLLHPRSVFLIANAIVLLLFVFSRREPSSSSSCSSSQDPHDQFLSFAAPPLLLPPITEAPAPAPAPEEDAVFEDKQAVHVTVRVPRRSRSEKIGGGKPGLRRRARSPEMRRSESENGRRRRSMSSAAPEEWCVEDDEEEEFRRAVEAFIAKQQTRFHREECLVLVAGAGAGDDAQAITVAAVPAVK